MNSELVPEIVKTNTPPSPTTGLMHHQPNNSLPRMSSDPPYTSQHFQGANQGDQSNFMQNQTYCSQTVQSSTLPSPPTGFMHHQPNNSLPRMSTDPPYPCQDQSDAMGIQHFQGANQGDQSNFLQNQTYWSQTVQSSTTLPSPTTGFTHHPCELDVYHASGNMGQSHGEPSRQTQKKKRPLQQSQDSGQREEERRLKNRERSQINRDKAKEYKVKKHKSISRGLTETVQKLTTERTALMNQIDKLNAEKMELKKEKEEVSTNMTAITEHFRKLAAQYESISCRQLDEQTNRQSEFQKIHQRLGTVLIKVLEVKCAQLAASKSRILDLDGFQHSNEQIPTQNRPSDITRIRTSCNPISALTMEDSSAAAQSQQASTSCPQPNEPIQEQARQPNEPIQEQARQPTVEQFHPPNCSTLQQSAPESFQTTQNSSHISSGVQDPQRTKSTSIGGGVVSSTSHLTENQEISRATSKSMDELLNKVDEKRKSKANFSDFPGLPLDQDEVVKVGEYNLPKSLQGTAQKIIEEYGDVTEKSIMHPEVNKRTFILFCASKKEMDDVQLDQITEDCILKWSDTINTALAMRFNVKFAMDQLKENIVPFYIDRIELEASWNDLKQKYAKKREQSTV
ncbi:hypothetical protein HRI_004198600 [Hibiscus trionum]|uniref:BZIP domain-containing protein n=1 Tax=Hibiscus trionum TaxID=183268 RepID=A0A9W7J4P2_HIBTR|nr:hypothetical protein HRI_004198600 [Hibiscus trionum]